MKNSAILYSINVNGANPNGDPDNDNLPRIFQAGENSGKGFITAYCIKRKIRNRMEQDGIELYTSETENIYQKTKIENLIARMNPDKKEITPDDVAKFIRDEYLDVRLFGSNSNLMKVNSELLGCKESKKKDKEVQIGLSIAHPSVTCLQPISINPIDIHMQTITCCQKMKPSVKDENGKKISGENTMGKGVARVYGSTYIGGISILKDACKKNGVTDDDIEKLQYWIKTMYRGDQSEARPDGSMCVRSVIKVDYTYSDDVDSMDIYNIGFKLFSEDGKFDVEKLKKEFPTLEITVLK